MSASVVGGPRTTGGGRNSAGYREYKVVHIVHTTSSDDGPAIVINASGLPLVGAIWNFGNDLDVWAYCWPDMKVSRHQEEEGDPTQTWRVEQKFSTQPMGRDPDEEVEDPLLAPQKVSGSFVKYTEEIEKDRNGTVMLSSSHELLRGPRMEFDRNRPTVRVEQNVAALGLATFSEMVDQVNDAALWGLSARCVKLSNVQWERKHYSMGGFYYTRIFDFDIDYDTFDRQVADRGTKALNGHWEKDAGTYTWVLDDIDGDAPDRNDPRAFINIPDPAGGGLLESVLLDGYGKPWDGDGGVMVRDVEAYDETNMLVLGIPTYF